VNGRLLAGLTLFSALGGAVGGIGYVVVRYLVLSASDVPRVAAGLYVTGGIFVGILPGAMTALMFCFLLATARERVRYLWVLFAILSGMVGTVLTWVCLVALGEAVPPLPFLAIYGALSSAWLGVAYAVLAPRAAARPPS